MRTLLRVTMEHEAANEAVKKGRIAEIMKSTAALIKPEAAYFFTHRGHRCAHFFFDLKDSSQMPQIAEPFFTELHADVEFFPVMNQEDLMKGLQALGR
jgi:hypothetical protein